MSTVRTIVDKIGREALAQEVGVSTSAVGNAVASGVFPASWYAAVSGACRARRIKCPMDLFSFKAAPKAVEQTRAAQ
jgi:hypothetical protein